MEKPSRVNDLTNSHTVLNSFRQSTNKLTIAKRVSSFSLLPLCWLKPVVLWVSLEGLTRTSSASPRNMEEDIPENESGGAFEEVNSHIKAVFEFSTARQSKFGRKWSLSMKWQKSSSTFISPKRWSLMLAVSYSLPVWKLWGKIQVNQLRACLCACVLLWSL